jgi:hypothetical protein
VPSRYLGHHSDDASLRLVHRLLRIVWVSASSFVRRHPALASVIAYLVVASLAVVGALRPGRTLVPSDIIAGIPPFDQLAHGPPHNGIVSDASLQFFPWMHFLGEQLREGRLPHWNPNVLGGVPVTPNGFFSLYYPPFWLVRVLSPYDAYDAFVWLHLVLAAVGVRWLARRLRASHCSSFVVGLGALVTGMWLHWSFHLVHFVAMVLLPFALAAVHQVIEAPSLGRVVVLALLFGVWWLGGNPQFVYYGTLTLAVFAFFVLAAQWRKRRHFPLVGVAAVAAGIGLGSLLAAPVLLPTATIGPTVLRSREPEASVSQSHLSSSHLIRALIPDAKGNPVDDVAYRSPAGYPLDTPYVGVVVLVLCGSALASARRNPAVLALLGGGLLIVVLSFTSRPNAVLYHSLPAYDRFRAISRWLCVLPALALPAAALGFDNLRHGLRSAVRGAFIAAGLLTLPVVVWATQVLRVSGAPHRYFAVRAMMALGLLALTAGAAALGRRRPAATAALILVGVTFEVAFVTPRWYPSLRKETAYPVVRETVLAQSRGGRILRVGSGLTPVPGLSPVIPMVYGIPDAQGQAVLFPRNADRYLRIVDDYGTFAEGTNVAPPVTKPARVRSAPVAAFDVRTVLADPGLDVPGAERLSAGNPSVWAVPSSGPAVVVKKAIPAAAESMWAAVADPGWDPLASAAVEGLSDPVSGTGGIVRQVVSTPDHDTWSVESESGGFLRVSAAYAAGWTATIDGRSTRVLRADGLFRGVVVGPGRHTISFRYRNRDEERGITLALIAVVAIALTLAKVYLFPFAGRRIRKNDGHAGEVKVLSG